MTVTTLLNIALWVLTILGYIIYNLYAKNVKLENIVENQNNTITAIQSIVESSDKMLSEMDRRGIFKSDDEVGAFFNAMMEVQKILNQFTKR